MKRRLAIARTLAGQGEIVILDEPFTGLDEELRVQVAQRVFDRLKKRPVLLVTHDSLEAQRFQSKEVLIN